MSPDELSERARQVLQALLFEYTVTAEPVGSRQLAKKYALGLSPATIRNTMADLEEMGYLASPTPRRAACRRTRRTGTTSTA